MPSWGERGVGGGRLRDLHCPQMGDAAPDTLPCVLAGSGSPSPGAPQPRGSAHLADAAGRLQPGALLSGARAVLFLLRDHRSPPLGRARLEAEARTGPSRPPRRVLNCPPVPGGKTGRGEGRGAPSRACETFLCPVGDSGGSDGQQSRSIRERGWWPPESRPRPPTREVPGVCGHPWQPSGLKPSGSGGARSTHARATAPCAARWWKREKITRNSRTVPVPTPSTRLPCGLHGYRRAVLPHPTATGTFQEARPKMLTMGVLTVLKEPAQCEF